MNELVLALVSAMLGYFLMRLDGLEKKIDNLENLFLLFSRRELDEFED